MDFKYEMVVPNVDLPCKFFIFEGKNGNYRRANHWHQSVEIFLVLEGELKFYINNQSQPLSAGELIIVNSNEIHSIEAPKPNLTLVLQIPVSYFTPYMGKEDYAIFVSQSQEKNRALAVLIEKMYHVYTKKEKAYLLKMQSLFYELLYQMATEFMKTEADEGNLRQKRHLDRLSQITSYMKKHYDQPITLESVAETFGFSPNYLSRMFRLYAGISYKTYLLNLRTEYAFREMLHTDRSLNDIAINNGFPNSRAFAKSFLKRYDCLPGEYRKKIQLTASET